MHLVITDLGILANSLCALIVITHSDLTLTTKTLGPEAFEGWRGAGHAVVGEEEPEAEDWLGEDVKNGVGNNLGINVGDAGTVSNAPDTA